MSALLGELRIACDELVSEVMQKRNKGAELLDSLLANSKAEFIALFHAPKADHTLTVADIFSNAIIAIANHARKIEEVRDTKSSTTLRNKNYVYSGLITKLIDYNLEDDNNFLPIECMFNAFCEGFGTRNTLIHFGSLYLYILERGIYKSVTNLRLLKVNQFSRILSYLFEANIGPNDNLRYDTLKCLTKTIELAHQYVQITVDIIVYLQEIVAEIVNAKGDRFKAEAIKLFHQIIVQLSVDYRRPICNEIQNILPAICGFYDRRMKLETKGLIFESIYLSLCTMYPHLNKGNLNAINITICDNWKKTLKKCYTLIEMEILERNQLLVHRHIEFSNDTCYENFLKMSAVVFYLNYWQKNETNDEIKDSESSSSRCKVARTEDGLETALKLVQPNSINFNQTWLGVLAELLTIVEDLLNISNYKQILEAAYDILQSNLNEYIMQYVRLCLTSLLLYDKKSKTVPTTYITDLWSKIVDHLLAGSSTNKKLVAEKQLLVQTLIKYGKLRLKDCTKLLETFMIDSTLKRNECIGTVRQMLIYADSCQLDKTAPIIGEIIKWANTTPSRIDAKSVLLNVAPADVGLVCDCCAIAAINFLNENQKFDNESIQVAANAQSVELLAYKYNKKLVCIEKHYKESKMLKNNTNGTKSDNEKPNCLFQSNYEILMQALNIETSKETTAAAILVDLVPLLKMTVVMKKFLDYKVFDETNFVQCPLIKRIGFFLSHLEFQMKSNNPRNIEHSDILEILTQLQAIIDIFTKNKILLNYLETQHLEELLNFLGKTLIYKAATKDVDFQDNTAVVIICLKILARLCTSSSHQKDAFAYIAGQKINIKRQLMVFLDIISIFCEQENTCNAIALWFVNILKSAFQLYYTNTDFIRKIIQLLPGVLIYVEKYDVPFQNMLIALISLLKIAYKKSYSIEITVQLIDSIRLITRKCGRIGNEENLRNICFSVAKFLTFPSLEIQFATINTLTALMDVNWLQVSPNDIEFYYDFCQDLYKHINWQSIPPKPVDVERDSISVTIQIFAAIFLFSSYHQEVALQEMTHYCVLKKLTKADFTALNEAIAEMGSSLKKLTKPFMTNVLHYWISKLYPISKFPYYICCDDRNDFNSTYISTIAYLLLMYGEVEEFQKLEKIYTVEEMIHNAQPNIEALMFAAKSPSAQSYINEYKKSLDTMFETLNNCHTTLFESVRHPHKNICSMILMCQDEQQFREMFQIPIFYQQKKWFNIDYESLIFTIYYFQKRKPFDASSNESVLGHFMLTTPQILVHALGDLKKNCCEFFFINDTIKCFHLWCTLANLVIDAMPTKLNISQRLVNITKFFLRDIICFNLQFLKNSHTYEMQRVSLIFLAHIINKPVLKLPFCSDLLKSQSHEISKTLVAVTKRDISEDNKKIAFNILNSIDIRNNTVLDRALDEVNVDSHDFSSAEYFAELHNSIKNEDNGYNAIAVIESFLLIKNLGAEGLKSLCNHISTSKSQLQVENKLLYELMRYLLGIVRKSEDETVRLEASKCLGELGALKIDSISYFFRTETDTSFYNEETLSLEPIKYFGHHILMALEKLIIVFKADTFDNIIEVAVDVVNCRSIEKVTENIPFFTVFETDEHRISYLNGYTALENIDWLSIFKSSLNNDYNKWISNFVSKIFKKCAWTPYADLAANDANFADAVLQPFVKLIMENKELHLGNLIKMLEYFFRSFEEVESTKSTTDNTREIFKNKRVISKLLNICECIRIHNDWKLPLNLLNISKACNYCEAYFLSIMYLELWASDEKPTGPMKSHVEMITFKNFQTSAMKAYKSINCCDAIAGFLNPFESRIEFFNLNNNWSSVLLNADLDETVSHQLYNDILKRNAMLSIAGANKTDQIDYEVYWRLMDWNALTDSPAKCETLNDLEYEFEKNHYKALRFVKNREENNVLSAVSKARSCVLNILKDISVECLQNVYKYQTWLHLLQQIEDFCQIQFNKATNIDDILEKWQTEINLQYGSFKCKEQLLTHQIVLFNTAGIRANRKIKEFYNCNPIENCLLKCISECRKAGELNLAERNIAVLRKMNVSSISTKVKMLVEDAEISYDTGKLQISQAILQHMFENKNLSKCIDYTRALLLQGEYAMETNAVNFDIVLREYFKKSLQLLDKYMESKDKYLKSPGNPYNSEEYNATERMLRKNALESIAKYADREYTQLNTYVNSAEFQMRCQIIEQNKQAAGQVASDKNIDKTVTMGATYMKRSANLDEKEIQTLQNKRTEYLCVAVEYYMKFCTFDETISSPAIYRIIGLWFANKQNEMLEQKITENIDSIQSYKFICALNQITARLNSRNVNFVNMLKNILVRCVKEHPHHTLYQLFPLVYAFKDGEVGNDRVAVAKQIITQGTTPANAKIIKELELIFPALIDFANVPVADNRSGNTSLSDKLRRFKNIEFVHCPTIHLPISVNQKYKITSIVKWDEKVSMVGGINAPKKLMCHCSDGRIRPQLLKGKDDLRQDAVMQQVFLMFNDILSKEPEAVERKLMLRTYKVVPLSMRSGILEWCEDTITIGKYLFGDSKGGAHKKYRPNDYTVSKCRQLSMQHMKSGFEKRHEIFLHICQNIKPVLHYFFFEKFLMPGIWFERRLAYTNSVATTSIVGYMLGLGDRHTQNILLDEKTAEVIHIDFGIAFEQGKIMPTPETVPFRLTRDIVDPMGICVTNGIFKKSCEATMRILRYNHLVITTILEVLLYDPLYLWNVVQKANTDTNSQNEEHNLLAQRALICIQNKLEGKQNGILGTVQADVQVERLINEATSSRNLCLLYHGWDPYV